MNLDTLSRGELFREISDLARSNGVATQAMWTELVSEVVDSHLDLGELDRDQDLVGLKTHLSDQWPEYQREADEEMKGEAKNEEK